MKLTRNQKTGMYLLLMTFAAGIVMGWMLGLVHSAAGRAHGITMEQKGW